MVTELYCCAGEALDVFLTDGYEFLRISSVCSDLRLRKTF